LYSDVPALSNNMTWSTFATGPHHTCALNTDGNVYCWGRNQFGEIGNGKRWLDAPPTAAITFP
jgi:alpha-tubulin suppressor-like RCC1 family protein